MATILFLAVLFTDAGFQQNPINTNVASRLFLDFSIITRGTVAIDAYAPLTIDKAAAHEHFYSDKAPGQSLLALPILYAAWRPLMAGHPGAPNSRLATAAWPLGYWRVAYLASLSTSAPGLFLCPLGLAWTATGCLLAREMRAAGVRKGALMPKSSIRPDHDPTTFHGAARS